MHIVRGQNTVEDFDEWKKMFDSDPLDRKGSGVKAYRVMRATDDPNLVLIDLEFDDADKAGAMLESLKGLWERVDVMKNPEGRIAEVVDAQELG